MKVVSTAPSANGTAARDDIMLEWALVYAALGWRVFPVWWIDSAGRCACGKSCSSPGKHPIGHLAGNWKESATTDTATIRRWWTSCPSASIATPDWLRIDIDRGGVAAWSDLVARHGVPETVKANTPGGGRHLYFEAPAGWIASNKTGRLPAGVDVRGPGVGYTLLPPSKHVSGGRYLWADGCGPDELQPGTVPDWLLELLVETQRPERPSIQIPQTAVSANYGPSALEGIVNDFLAVPAGIGRRHDEFRGAAMRAAALVKAGVLDESQMRLRLAYAATGSDFPEEEALLLVDSALEKAGPRAVQLNGNGTAGDSGQEPRKFGTWADLENRSAVWAWVRWIVLGSVHLLVAESGKGKSSSLLRIVYSFVDPSVPFPDGSFYQGPSGKVLWAESESAQFINRDRAAAWGMDRTAFVTPLPDPNDDFRLDLPEHQAALREIAFRDDIRVIVVDSLSGSHRRRENDSNEQMDLMGWLAGLARDCQKPFLITHHLRKRGMGESDDITLDRVRGSVAIIQLARVVWALDQPDPTQVDQRRLKQIKNNLQRIPDPIGVTISETGVSFGTAPQVPRAYTELDRAVDFLRDELEQGPRTAATLLELAQGHDISKATLQRARKAISVRSVKQIGGIWQWELPVGRVHNSESVD